MCNPSGGCFYLTIFSGTETKLCVGMFFCYWHGKLMGDIRTLGASLFHGVEIGF